MASASDVREDEVEYDPQANPPQSARPWLRLIEEAEKTFEDWQQRCDSIDKLYSNLSMLAKNTRDRQFQLFWANVEVLKPSIYARPPVPVVVPKFKDRRPLYRTSSEMLERCSVVAFDLTDIDTAMRLVRDDIAVVGRGAPWIRYETKAESRGETERVCIEHKDRKDFLHDPARNWAEVGWVAGASYLTRKEMRKRFRKTSGDEYQGAEYLVRRDERELGGTDSRERAKVWELWHRHENRVVWVAAGCDKLLDSDEPHLKLEGFFPCPKPAYATVQRGSLIPVPDMVYYRDQLEEINELTGRIHALSQSVKVRGFYPAGAGEIGDAVEAAIKSTDDRQVLVPISSMAAFGNGSAKDTIVWLPIDLIVATIQSLVELRRQIIDDVYQIMGLSDIMRGTTDASETLGAQQLKSQYGSVRIRDKQSELVRVARDALRIAAEIMAENFSRETLLEMSQMDIPTDADIAKQVAEKEKQAEAIVAQVKAAQSDPQMMQQAQANPEQAQGLIRQAEEQVKGLGAEAQKLRGTPTIEKVMKFLRDQKTRAFVLDIETDSTIQPDEDAEKQRRTEFMTALGTLLPQLGQMIEAQPASAGMAGDLLKFATAPFRVGRELEGSIDEFIEAMKAQAGKPKPNPEQAKAEAEGKLEQQRIQAEDRRSQAEMAMKQQEMQVKAQIEAAKMQGERETRMLDAEMKQRESAARLQQIEAQSQRDAQKGELEIAKLQMDMEARQQELAIKRETAQIDQAMQVQSAEIQSAQARQQADQSERAFVQKSQLAVQQAATRQSPTP